MLSFCNGLEIPRSLYTLDKKNTLQTLTTTLQSYRSICCCLSAYSRSVDENTNDRCSCAYWTRTCTHFSHMRRLRAEFPQPKSIAAYGNRRTARAISHGISRQSLVATPSSIRRCISLQAYTTSGYTGSRTAELRRKL